MAVTVHQLSQHGPAVLLLPGFGADRRVWGEFGSLLTGRFAVTTLDWPGHGDAPASSGPVDLIAETRNATQNVSGYTAVIAVGFACGAAVQLALEHRAAGLVLMEPRFDEPLDEADIDYEAALHLRFAQFQPASEAIRTAMSIDDPDQRRQALADALIAYYEDKLGPDDRARIRAMLADLAETGLDTAALTPMNPPWVRRIRDVRTPVLVIGQNGDTYVRESRRALAARAPNGRLALLDSDIEYPWLSRPQETAQVIADFVTEIRLS